MISAGKGIFFDSGEGVEYCKNVRWKGDDHNG